MQRKKYVFECEKACRSFKSGDRELWTLTIRAKDLPRTFQYGPNARYATLVNKPAKEMLTTLKEDPASFVFKNNGIMLVADSIKATGDSIELVCLEADPEEDAPGHGVLNGGHTYKVLLHALGNQPAFPLVPDQAVLIATVGIGIPEEEISKISRARNTSEKVPLHALRELAGDWQILKQYLPEHCRGRVAFKPNEPGSEDAEFDVTDLVRRLALINNVLFPAESGSHPVTAYTSVGSLVRKFEQKRFLEVAPLLPDVLWLEEQVIKHWERVNGRGPDKLAVITAASGCSTEETTILNGYKASLTVADPFVLPVVAAFRVFIHKGAWTRPLPELWEKFGPRTVRALWETYKEQGKSSAAVFGRARGSWAATCELTKSAAIQEGLIRVE